MIANFLLATCVAANLVLQGATTPAFVRIGPTGEFFTPDDLAQITRLAEEAAGQPWLLIGLAQPFDPRPGWDTEVYFEPDRSAPGIRRGRGVNVEARLASKADYAGAKTWRLSSTFVYAQVTVPGREPASVEGSRDRHRPFRVHGDISDEVLLAVIAIVRSSPTVPRPAGVAPDQPYSPLLTEVRGTLPIVRVRIEGDNTIAVSLGTDPSGYSGQTVYLQTSGGKWVVRSLRAFMP